MKRMPLTVLALVVPCLLAWGMQAQGGNHAGAKPGFKPMAGAKPGNFGQQMQKMGFGGTKPDGQKMGFPGATKPDFAKQVEEMKKKKKERGAESRSTSKGTKEDPEKDDKTEKD